MESEDTNEVSGLSYEYRNAWAHLDELFNGHSISDERFREQIERPVDTYLEYFQF